MHAVHAIVHRREQCRRVSTQRVDDGVRVVRGGGLALGAGDADQCELTLRVVVVCLGENAECFLVVGDDEPGRVRVRRIIVRRHVRRHAELVRLLEVFRIEVPFAYEQTAWRHRARVVGDCRERHLVVLYGGRVHGPHVRGDDLMQQILREELACCGLQRQRHGSPLFRLNSTVRRACARAANTRRTLAVFAPPAGFQISFTSYRTMEGVSETSENEHETMQEKRARFEKLAMPAVNALYRRR